MGKEQKIKQCKSCGKQLDKSAKICPSCGKDQRTFFGKHKILTGILVLLIIGAIGGGSEDKTPSTEQASSGKTDTEVSNQNKNEKNNEEPVEETFKLGPGHYKVGEDLEEGLYLALSQSGFSYLEVSKDSSGELDSIISNDNFSTNRYIYVSDGQYLKLQDAELVKHKETQLDMSDPSNLKDGMYKVGVDIKPGEYKVKSDSLGYVEVSKNAKGVLSSIISNDNFEGEKYVTVKKGQYLKLNGAELIFD